MDSTRMVIRECGVIGITIRLEGHTIRLASTPSREAGGQVEERETVRQADRSRTVPFQCLRFGLRKLSKV